MLQFIKLGAFFAGMAVVLGAFGAHGLEGKLTARQMEVYDTAVAYQMYHAIALILTGLLSHWMDDRLLKIAGWLFFAGILCFSGSLYLLSAGDTMGVTSGVRAVVGPITPIGGVLFIGGWGCLIFGKRKK